MKIPEFISWINLHNSQLSILWIRHSLQASIASTHRHVHVFYQSMIMSQTSNMRQVLHVVPTKQNPHYLIFKSCKSQLGMIEITHLNNTNSSFGFFSSLFLIIHLCSSIRLTQLIQLQRRFFGRDITRTTFFLRAEIYRGRLFVWADRSLGAKQEGLTIVHFLNKLIVSCKEAVRFPF